MYIVFYVYSFRTVFLNNIFVKLSVYVVEFLKPGRVVYKSGRVL